MTQATTSYNYTGTLARFTATNGGTYRITAYGAQGGAYNGASNHDSDGQGGLGAKVSGVFQLAADAVLTIIVGGQGSYGADVAGGGGGGGTFVIETFDGSNPSNTTLLIAGGGGGGGYVDAINPHPKANGEDAASNVGNGSGLGGSGSAAYSRAGGGGGGTSGGVGGKARVPSPSSNYDGSMGSSTPGVYTGGRGGGSFNDQPAGNGGYGGGGGGGGFHGGNGGAAGSGGGYSYGGGGGGSVDTGQDALLTVGVDTGAGSVQITPLCLLRGTRILTPTGEVRVEALQVGDPVVTRFGGIQPVKWIGRHSHPAGDPALTPVCIHAGALGDHTPARDLYVSPGHSVLVGGTLLLARLLVNGVTVTQGWCPPRIDYVHVELAAHDCVIAEGAWSETYADAHVSRAAFDNAAEYEALYPEDGPAPDEFILCAPRPEGGPKLEAALRPVIARAAVAPGSLAGSIDRVDGAWRVQGWAYDPAHPELPVLLEVELDGRVIGTVAACEHRADLAQAGFGTGVSRGRCAFTFTSPVRLRPELLHSLRIRRTADGAPLAMHESCAAGIPAAKEVKRAGPRLVAI